VKTLKAEDRDAWGLWLRENHEAEREVWLLFYKKHAGKRSVSYDEAVEVALCYGWIDSIIRRVDDESYAQKFTPRKPGSTWSESNLARMKRLIDQGRVTDTGMTVYTNRSPERPDTEKLRERSLDVPSDFEASLKGNKLAWKNFQHFPPSHRKQYLLWIMSAKRPETRQKRILEAVNMIAKGSGSLLK